MHRSKNKILIAPLNWGLGHASRCIPIINFLIINGFEPIIASDGIALKFLEKEFPEVKTIKLPSYKIRYSKFSFLLKLKLLISFFSIRKAVKKEHKIVQKLLEKEKISGIISDNRFGVYSKEIISVYMTHQLQILSGYTSYFSTAFHQKIISKFYSCWIPDVKGNANLTGKLSGITTNKFPLIYVGNLSRFKAKKTRYIYDVLILLSGPEPQRTILEKKLNKEFQYFRGKVFMVRGILKETPKKTPLNFTKTVNYLLTEELQKAINCSKLVLARSGYSTIMDLAKMKKRAFFIPTPGQSEQYYLAKYLEGKKITPFSFQCNFKIDKLRKIKKYSGFVEDHPAKFKEIILETFRVKNVSKN